jgi:hypothetical protein
MSKPKVAPQYSIAARLDFFGDVDPIASSLESVLQSRSGDVTAALVVQELRARRMRHADPLSPTRPACMEVCTEIYHRRTGKGIL